MRRCYLHIGTPKTGSTAIQYSIHENAAVLLEQGLLVPTVGCGPQGGHHPLIKALLGIPVPPRLANSPRQFIEVAERHPNANVVVSAELLTGNLQSQPAMEAVLSFFRRCGFEVVLLGYFRNQPQHLNSGYSQAVKALQLIGSFDRHANHLLSSGQLDYAASADLAAGYGLPLIARPFNAAVKAGGVINDFLRTVGVDLQACKLAGERRDNRSLGPCAVAAVLEMVRRAAERNHAWTHPQRVAGKALINHIADEPQFTEKPFCGFDTEGARGIQSFYRPSNDRFAKAMWGDDWASVFKEDVEAEFERNVFEPETASPERKDLYSAILERFWSGMQPIMTDPRFQKERPLQVAERTA